MRSRSFEISQKEYVIFAELHKMRFLKQGYIAIPDLSIVTSDKKSCTAVGTGRFFHFLLGVFDLFEICFFFDERSWSYNLHDKKNKQMRKLSVEVRK